VSIEAQDADDASTLRLTRAALRLRRSLHDDGTWTVDDDVVWDVTGDGALVARRGTRFRLVIAMGSTPARLGGGRVLLATAPLLDDGSLPVDAAAWVVDETG
jgi:alpha-glucosidase